MTELKNCLIMSAQDMDLLGDERVFDISEGGEDFTVSDFSREFPTLSSPHESGVSSGRPKRPAILSFASRLT